MSGGSYNYLFVADTPEEAMGKSEDLKNMADRLTRDYPEHPVTRFTRRLAATSVERIPREVNDVWHAVEWRDSNDWGQDQLDKVMEQTKDWRPGSGKQMMVLALDVPEPDPSGKPPFYDLVESARVFFGERHPGIQIYAAIGETADEVLAVFATEEQT